MRNIIALFVIILLLCQVYAQAQGVATADTSICQGRSVVLSAPSAGVGGSYSWSQGGGNTQTITISPNFSTLYIVTVTPLVGNPSIDSFAVTVTPAPVVTLTFPLICAGFTASITASVTIPGGSFSWSPVFDTTAILQVAPTSTTTYYVTYTVPGCNPALGNVTVTVYPQPAVSVQVDSSQCSVNIVATGSGGLSPFQYDINNGAFQSASTFNNVGPGNNTVTVKDAHNCSASTNVNIPISAALALGFDTIGITCNGDDNGSLIAIATGGSAPFQFSINNGSYQSSDTFANLTPGNYTMNVKDGNGCFASSALIALSQPLAVALSFDTVNVTCNGASNGAITANASNGTAPYQYALNSGTYQSSGTFPNLAPGNYFISAKDVNGCPASDSVPVVQTFVLSMTFDSVNTGCNGATTGAIIVDVTAGTPPFQYAVDNNAFQSSDSLLNLAVGTYSVRVMDGNGCTVSTGGINISQATQVGLSAIADSALCFGNNNGAVIGTVTGGTLPYQYTLNGGVAQSSDTFANLAAGSYTINVQDVNGCSASASVQVYEPDPLTISVVGTTVLCPGDQNGTFIDSSSGGTPPYLYSASSDGAIFYSSTTNITSGLDTGAYTIYVVDANGCPTTGTGYIPNALVDSFSVVADSTSCFGPQYTDGAVQVTALSNTNVPYQFSLNGEAYQFSSDFPDLASGVYNVAVQNTLGCIIQIPPVTVYEATEAFVKITPPTDTLQLGQSIQLTSTFGPFPADSVVSYFWNPAEGISCVYCPDPVAAPYSELNNYTLTITYNSHCTVSTDVTVFVENSQKVFVPNSFTPNNDGYNDLLYVYASNIKTANLRVFNRWGEEVFESADQFLGWDGKYKGVLQPQGVYSYYAQITFLDDSQVTKNGSVTLLR